MPKSETKYSCPHCHQHVVLGAPTPGIAIQCPNCGVSFTLPDESRGGRGLGSPWIWCLGAVIAIALTFPLLFKSGLGQEKSDLGNPVGSGSPFSKLPTEGFQWGGKSLPDWVDESRSTDTRIATHAQEVLQDHAGEVKGELVRMLKGTDSHGSHRRKAAEAMGYVVKKTDPEMQVLLDALGDPDGNVRAGAASALRRIKVDTAVLIPVLTAMADSPDSGIRHAAAILFSNYGVMGPDARPAIEKLAVDDSPEVRRYGVVALARFAPPKFVFTDARLSSAVADLGSADKMVQSKAHSVIRERGPGAISELVSFLQNREVAGYERSLAARALGYAGGNGDAEVNALFAAVKDPETLVRTAALSSLGMLHPDPKALVPVCLEALADNDSGIRRKSVVILGKLGADAASAIPELKNVAKRDKKTENRIAAKEALRKLGVAEAGSEAKRD